MGSVLRPFLAGCALTALVAGAAWWMHAGGSVEIAKPPAAPTDATTDVGVVVDAPKPATRTVVVRVLDAEDEHPIAGAHVTLRLVRDEIPPEDAKRDTDEKGVARLEVTTQAQSFDLLVQAAGHVREWRQEEDVGAADEMLVQLDRAGRVHGVVRAADGQPVDGVAVSADIENHADWPDDESVVTANGGVYDIDGIEVAEDFSVSVTDPGRIASRGGLVVTTAGEVVTADLTLADAASLRVRVLWPDGLPVAGASIEVQPSGDSAETDDTGRAALDALPAGRHHVVVRRAGFADAETDVDLAPGESRSVDVRLVPNAILSGIVIDDAGFPVADAEIVVDAQSGPRARTRTRADGKFRIACPDEDAHDLVVTHEGHCDTTVNGVTAPSEDLRIVVARRPKIRCRLVLPAGVAMPRHVAAWWENRNATNSVENGVLTIDASPGSGHVSFQAPGCVVVEREAEAVPGQVVDLGDVVLAAAPKLKGRVLDERGRAIDAFVYAKVGGAQVPLTSTDEDGTFEVDGLPAGAAEVRVEAKGFVQRTVHYAFAPGGKPEVIVLKRGGGVKGKVVDESGMPAPKAVYVAFTDVNDPDNKDRQAFPSIEDDGTFEVRLMPGRYTALTTLDDGQGKAEVVVVDGETRELTISINR